MIDKTSIIDTKTKIDKNVQVETYSVIGPNDEMEHKRFNRNAAQSSK